MGDPAGEEHRGRGHVKVGRRVGHGPTVNEIADMIEGHKDHHGPTNRVDRLQAPCGGCGRKVNHCVRYSLARWYTIRTCPESALVANAVGRPLPRGSRHSRKVSPSTS